MIYTLMPIIFLLGILAIALEEKIHINKAASALLMALLLWGLFALDAVNILGSHSNFFFDQYLKHNPELLSLSPVEQYSKYIIEHAMLTHLGDVSQTLFFVMSTMIIIELTDSHGGFRAVSTLITTRNKRKLLWIICLLTFFMAALINNMACAIVVIALLRKLITNPKERIKIACLVIISANAGGSFSPIGDVTTILLWTGGNISALHQISHLFIPSLITMLLPLSIMTFHYKKGEEWEALSFGANENQVSFRLSNKARLTILIIGILSLALVPVFREVTGLPPFMGVMFGLVILWIYTDFLYGKIIDIEEHQKLKVSRMTSLIDMPTILFFFGILMAVAALQSAGQLGDIAGFIDAHVNSPLIVSFILGVMSSFIDNVALVAGTMGMYQTIPASEAISQHLQYFVADGGFWTFIAYCAVNGGSLLIIGSATGVAVMGMEKITFGYYLKYFTWLATLGYIAGALTYVYL